MAVRRNPNFRFDYFLRSLPVDLLGRRCEQLMRAAEKEVEALETKARENAGLLSQPVKEGDELPPIQLPKYRVMEEQRRRDKRAQAEIERKQLAEKLEEIEIQMRQAQNRLKSLNESGSNGSNGTRAQINASEEVLAPEKENGLNVEVTPSSEHAEVEAVVSEREDGAPGFGGEFLEFPAYDGDEPPQEIKKPFTHFCVKTRKEVKASLDPSERKNKVRSSHEGYYGY